MERLTELKVGLQLQADLLDTELSVADAENALEDAKAAIPFNTQNIVDAQIALESAQDGLKRAKAIQSELFPAGK
jgi:hypothetical protein